MTATDHNICSRLVLRTFTPTVDSAVMGPEHFEERKEYDEVTV